MSIRETNPLADSVSHLLKNLDLEDNTIQLLTNWGQMKFESILQKLSLEMKRDNKLMKTYTLDAILPFTILEIYLCQFHNYHYS